MNENKSKLTNAGFKEQETDTQVMWISGNGFNISVTNLCFVNVYFNGKPTAQAVISQSFHNLDHLRKICYPFLNKDLDFTAKPKYDWETVFDKFPAHKHNKVINTEIGINVLAKEGMISKLEALSMIAKLKLNIIIQQIDKDYPKKEEFDTGVIFFNESVTELFAGVTESYRAKKYLVQTQSEEGAKILLDQNPQLLKNLFKIETDD